MNLIFKYLCVYMSDWICYIMIGFGEIWMDMVRMWGIL